MNKRLLSMFLVLCMIVSMLPVSAMAEETHTTIGGSGEIISFAPLTETAKAVSLGTSIEDLEFPETLTATVRTAVPADENPTQDFGSPETATPTTADEPEWEETTVELPVEWASPDYDMDTEGAYVFTPVIEGYTVSAPLPELTVTVGAEIMERGMVAPMSVTTYNIWVGGVQVTSANMGDVLGPMDDGTTVIYDSDTNTLTLNDAAIITSYMVSAAKYGIYAPFGLNLKLVGANSIALPNSGSYSVYGICTEDSDLQISEEHSGSLTVTAGNQFGIYSKNLTINSGAITTVSSVIFVGESVSISGGSVTSTGGTQGIVGKTITVSGGTVTASGSAKALTNSVGSPNFTGMQVTASLNENGTPVVSYDEENLATYKYIKVEPAATPPVLSEVADLTTLQSAITDAAGDLDLKLSDSFSYSDTGTIVINCDYNITIDLNGKTLDGGSLSAIKHQGKGALTIIDSKGGGIITGKTISGTIRVNNGGTVNINGGTVSATAGTTNTAIWVGYNSILNINGGTVSATGLAGTAIYTQNATVNISGGTVSATKADGNAIYSETGSSQLLNISGGTISAVDGTAIENNSTTIKTGTTIIIQGKTKAMAFAPTLESGVQAMASTNIDGSGSVAYNVADLATYKYLKFGLDITPPVLSAGSVNRTSNTAAAIGFTTDKAGTAYYLVVNSGASAPTSMAVKAGTSLGVVSGTVTGKAVTLTAGAKDIYVVVEDSAGNISTPLKISAAAYVAPDTTAPTVISVTVPSSGTYSTGNNLDFTVRFDENVLVTAVGGTPYISLTVGTSTRYARYVSGTYTSTLTFRYTVVLSDSDADGITVGALTLNGGTIQDAAGNNATLELNNIVSTSAVLVNPPAPSITGQPSPQTVDEGQTATFSVMATGVGLSYRWQVNTGSGFSYISNGGVYSGATTATLTITGATAGMNGYQYRAVVEGTYSPVATSTSALLTLNAAPTYTITFDPNGGTVSPTLGTTGTDGKLTNLPTPSKAGNTFNGWFTAASGGTEVTTSTVFAANDTIYAQWRPITYTITFDPNGGTVSPTSGTTGTDGKLTSLPTPSKTGNTFNGWFTAASGGTEVTTSTVFEVNDTIYAQWTRIAYTVTFDPNGGTVSPTSGTTGTDGKLTSLPTPSKTGNTFNGWFTAASGGTEVTTSTVFAVNDTIYAQWTRIAYTVTFNPNGGRVSEASRSVVSGAAVGKLPKPTRSGSYSFGGWYTAARGGIQIFASTTVSANVTYYAHWTYTSGGIFGSGEESSSNDDSSSVVVISTEQDKPDSATEGEIKAPGTVDDKSNVIVSITDKNLTDAFEKALADAKKNDTEQNGITVVLRVYTGNKTGSNVTVNLPKAVQDTIIKKKIASIIVVVDNPDIRIGMDLATMKEINRQAKSDVNITATRMNNNNLSDSAKTALGSRPVFDLKVNYGNGKEVSSFGTGSVTVTIPYTLGENEKAGNVQAVYVDSKGKVHWLVNSVYDSVEKVLRFSIDHFSTYGIGYKQDNTAFTDIAGHWAKEDIEFVVSRGLFSGTSEAKFSPNTSMTRGMFVTALGRLANADVSGYAKSSFSDVKNDAYYMGYIEWANKNNIVNGVGNGKFAPDQSITHEQMAIIMSNYAKTIGDTLTKVHVENTFADNAKISTYAKEDVKQMQMAGVIRGKNGNLFDPQGTATRAEVSAVLHRFVELVISSDTAQGWTTNDSGKWMYYESGKPVTGKKDIDGSSYTFDQYGVTADIPKNLRYTTYTVQRGNSFWSISRKLNCTMSELERLNNKSRFSLIRPGDVLWVPEK
ncbi:InlB B-repeat-containing protein [Konateibacter massiliensis]|uniref:InlB B-repeat-containing protein n=1 Tax=Konateibacter massiliensis TaxID=2002841 RepID=UPI000C14B10B|nr:InlB B-repeat-containing protein [Konateibacter massiliensis]